MWTTGAPPLSTPSSPFDLTFYSILHLKALYCMMLYMHIFNFQMSWKRYLIFYLLSIDRAPFPSISSCWYNHFHLYYCMNTSCPCVCFHSYTVIFRLSSNTIIFEVFHWIKDAVVEKSEQVSDLKYPRLSYYSSGT